MMIFETGEHLPAKKYVMLEDLCKLFATSRKCPHNNKFVKRQKENDKAQRQQYNKTESCNKT